MNRGPINGFVINGPAGDPVVRIRMDARGYARIRAGGRVLAYGKVLSTPAADLQGKLGRVEARLAASAVARAAIEGALGRASIRALLSATGRVLAHVSLPPIRGSVAAKASASIALTAHALMRGGVASTGQAKLAPATRLLRRGPVQGRGQANGAADGTVYARRWLRAPTDARGQAFVVSRSRIDARLAALTQARAVPKADFHVLARAPMQWGGVAFIEVDFAVNKQLPFDEPAPEYRTFRVQAGQHTFIVTE